MGYLGLSNSTVLIRSKYMHFMLITSKMELEIDENQHKILIEVPENMENAWNLPLHIERERKRIIAISLEGSISLSTCME